MTALLPAFVLGPIWGVAPWMAVAMADVVLMVRVRYVPSRALPIVTAVVVTAIAALVVSVVPSDALTSALTSDRVLSVLGL